MPHFGEYRPPFDIGGLGCYTYIVSTDGTNIWVSDHLGNRVHGPSLDVATEIQWAIDASAVDDVICIRPGTYTINATVDIDKKLHFYAYGATFIPGVINLDMFRFDNMGNLGRGTTWRGGRFDNVAYRANTTAFLIEDTTGVKISDVYFRLLFHGIDIFADDSFCESTIIENVIDEGSYEGTIRFRRTAGDMSFSQTILKDLYLNDVGEVTPCRMIEIGTGCGVTRSRFENITIWLEMDNHTGLYVDGNLANSQLWMSFESWCVGPAALYAIEIGPNAVFGQFVEAEAKDPYEFRYSTYVAAGGAYTAVVQNPGAIPYRVRNRGTGTMLNGTNTVNITHELVRAPEIVIITGHHAELEDAIVSAKAAATFTVSRGANVTADRTFDWYTEVSE